MTAALTRLPAALVVESQRRRLALATTTAIGIIEHVDRFVERRRCDRAGHLVERGLVPVLIEHHAAGATWWDIDHQIGMVRETSFSNDGRNFEMLLQFGNSERARWIFDASVRRDRIRLLDRHRLGAGPGRRRRAAAGEAVFRQPGMGIT